MRSTKYIIWEEQGRWHGHLQEYPDILEQGESFEDLQAKLCHLQQDLTSGNHDRCHTPPPSMAYPIPCRTKADDRLERMLSSMLNEP